MGAAIVRGITSGPHIPVYDLTVAGASSFVANGVIVHNCFRESMGSNAWQWQRDERSRWRIIWDGGKRQASEWLDPDEVERKRNEVTDAMWRTEYELQEPNPEGRAFNVDAVEAMFDSRFGEFAPKDGEELVLEEAITTGVYVTGADWAKTRDWTIIVTFRIDVKPWRVVAYLKIGRQRWPRMVARLNERLARYPGICAHDATGIGNVVNDYIDAEGSEIIPFVMSGQARADMLSEWVNTVEHDGVVCPEIAWPYSEHKYASYQQVFQPDAQNHTPDTIVAFALANHAASFAEGAWPDDPELDAVLDRMPDDERESFGAPMVNLAGIL